MAFEFLEKSEVDFDESFEFTGGKLKTKSAGANKKRYSLVEAPTGDYDYDDKEIYVQGFFFDQSDTVTFNNFKGIVSAWKPSDFHRVCRHEIKYEAFQMGWYSEQSNPEIYHSNMNGVDVEEYHAVIDYQTSGSWFIYYTKEE